MMLFARRPPSRAYRFVLRITGRALPRVDKVLRIHCALSAADHSVAGVTALAVHLGAAADCDELVELVHETSGNSAPPKYYEVRAFVAPAAEPRRRLPSGGGEDREHRYGGLIDPGQARIVLPEIRLDGGVQD